MTYTYVVATTLAHITFTQHFWCAVLLEGGKDASSVTHETCLPQTSRTAINKEREGGAWCHDVMNCVVCHDCHSDVPSRPGNPHRHAACPTQLSREYTRWWNSYPVVQGISIAMLPAHSLMEFLPSCPGNPHRHAACPLAGGIPSPTTGTAWRCRTKCSCCTWNSKNPSPASTRAQCPGENWGGRSCFSSHRNHKVQVLAGTGGHDAHF